MFYTGASYEETYRSASNIVSPHIYPRTIAGQTIIHLVYSSDEYCGEHDCGVKNIVYRNSSDNFKSRIDVTTNTSGNTDFPKVYVKSDGSVMVLYVSTEFNSTYLNIAMRTKAAGDANFSNRSDITKSTTADATNPNIGITSTGVVNLVYDSKEYCDSNSCTHRSVVMRTSADNFAARTDIGNDLLCNAVNPFIAVQGGGNDTIHLLWRLTDSGTCAGGASRYAKSSNNFVSPTLITRNHSTTAYGTGFTVKNDGTAYVFYITTWPTIDTDCGGWQYMYGKSTDNFADEYTMPGACINAGSPGLSLSPSFSVDGSDVIHVAYASAEVSGSYGTLVYRNSSDNFTAKTVIDTSSFVNVQYPMITVDSTGTKWIMARLGGSYSSAGINVYNSANSYQRVLASASTYGDYGVTADGNGAFWLSILNQAYCQIHSCSQLNIQARSLTTGEVLDVTKFTSGNVQISTPRLAQFPSWLGGRQEVYYNSNEVVSSFMNIVRRSSTDNFQNPVFLSNTTTGATSLSSRNEMTVDKDRNINLGVTSDGSAWLMRSLDFTLTRLSRTTGNYTDASTPLILVNPTNNEIAATYYGNEGAAWGGKFVTVGSTVNYYDADGDSTTFSADFDPTTGDLYGTYIRAEAIPGVRNFNIRKRSDAFATRTNPFLFYDDTILGSCTGWRHYFKIDSSGVQHLLYASREQNPKVCNVAYRNSKDWSKRRDISTQTIDAGPVNLFLKTASSPGVACYTTAFKIKCQVLPL